MALSKKLFSLNPFWPHYIALSATAIGIIAGFLRFFLIDRLDPLHCNALLNKGSWLDSDYRNWQPEGCMQHIYQPKDVATCLASRQAVFIGDSITRKLYFQFAHIVDPKLPTAPPDDDLKHSDHYLLSASGTKIDFIWDPYLNASNTHAFFDSSSINNTLAGTSSVDRPALLVVGSGLWYLRYADISGGLPAWESNVESLLNTVSAARVKAADEIVFLPVEEVVPSKLTPERRDTMHSADIDAMNSDLYHRITLPSNDPLSLFAGDTQSMPVSLPLIFNSMLDESQTEDGLHFSDAVVKAQANLLLNLRCNNAWPKKFPFDKTCCREYPLPFAGQLLILAMFVLCGPIILFLTYRRSIGMGLFIPDELRPIIIYGAAIAIIFIADRTGFWLKEQKQFSPWTFAFLGFAFTLIGMVTIHRGDKDMGFMSRDQTDEWKGWMQIVILIYHYLGASKISGIYNPVRVLVAAYLFMTGYGHTTYYVKKADFGFLRIAQVLVRLNLLTVTLAYTMNTDYLSYYFAPLVSMWYIVIYATMAIGSRFNDRRLFLVSKIILSMCIITWFMKETWLLEILFQFLERIFFIHWSAREWTFRVTLDMWIVYIGMFSALLVMTIREHRMTDHPMWPTAIKVAIGVSSFVLLWFFYFELTQESKFTYNLYHPYISFLPILAFVTLRNASPLLRSCTSRGFAFVGTCSLETFIIQYHLWLAGDTKGVLLILPGTRWRPLNFIISTIIFVYISDQVARATAALTTWICGGAEKALPTSTRDTGTAGRRNTGPSETNSESVPLTAQSGDEAHKDEEGSPYGPEPDTPIRPRRWLDRLAESPRQPSPGFKVWYGQSDWLPGVKTKLAVGVIMMWIANAFWIYP
ncbi:10 TM acyl transferase domain found in Cas1p-domain-containing protein [Hygrophoropsis aurantiaca]|uniref:10 TM acyl transferase domain found in Cas1p-domain-containing protein n=1 Tax=Hygrophoropsis aurantiaca TaxID=72124 RepID=A0ACB8ADY4_9AGAM|nr:10 TM acyl transferase domain found in Cas1p-domain-containing protein [Hygrophoropsis aurantiaca]